MLHVQQYLINGKTLADLEAELAISASIHPTDPLAILNYCQLASPKSHPIVRECRGLVLNTSNWSVVAKGFNRFFNWGELADEMSQFDFNNFFVQNKEDGSFVLIYKFCNEWRLNTRASFAVDNMQFQNFTWKSGIMKALGIENCKELDEILQDDITYVCEFCSPWNKVVREYKDPVMYLLTAFRGTDELSFTECDQLAQNRLFKRPRRHTFTNVEEIQHYLNDQSVYDPTYEGVVIRDHQNRRYKIKSSTYLALHRIGSVKENLFNPKNLLPFVLTGEKDELLCYFGEVKERLEDLENDVKQMFSTLESVWNASKHIEGQKDFALSIVGKTPFTGILFDMRKTGQTDLAKIWRNSGDLILKVLKKTTKWNFKEDV